MPINDDPVERLLVEFDGSEFEALLLRRAILRASAPLKGDHPAREALDVLTGNIDVTVMNARLDGWQDLRPELMRQWRSIRAAITAALN